MPNSLLKRLLFFGMEPNEAYQKKNDSTIVFFGNVNILAINP